MLGVIFPIGACNFKFIQRNIPVSRGVHFQNSQNRFFPCIHLPEHCHALRLCFRLHHNNGIFQNIRNLLNHFICHFPVFGLYFYDFRSVPIYVFVFYTYFLQNFRGRPDMKNNSRINFVPLIIFLRKFFVDAEPDRFLRRFQRILGSFFRRFGILFI